MYERFTDHARKCMQLANAVAQEHNQEYICEAHILIGIIKEGSGVACNALERKLNIDLGMMKKEMSNSLCVGQGEHIVIGRMYTLGAKLLIDGAINEAVRRKDNHVGTEHLLLAAFLLPTVYVGVNAVLTQKLSHEIIDRAIDELLHPENSQAEFTGDGKRPPEIVSFEHWWNNIQKQCEPHRATGRNLAKIAWNAALERAARECGAMQFCEASVDKDAVIDDAVAKLKRDDKGEQAGMSWVGIAKSAYKAYSASTGNKNFRGEEMPEFSQLPLAIRVAWEAAARQVGSCLHLEGKSEPPDEQRWANWIRPV